VFPYQAVISVNTSKTARKDVVLHKYTNSFPFLHDFDLHAKKARNKDSRRYESHTNDCIYMIVSALHNIG
jgi:hypothetical protein